MAARVLVVEDDPASAEMLSIALRQAGFETAVIGEGTKVMPALRELKPDLVLLDLMLPGMSGIDVCKAIRAESDVPIVVLTAKSDTVDVVLGLESGADDYMVKPPKTQEHHSNKKIKTILHRTDQTSPQISVPITSSTYTKDKPEH